MSARLIDHLLSYQQRVTEQFALAKGYCIKAKMAVLFVYGCCVLYGDGDVLFVEGNHLLTATAVLLTFNYPLLFSLSLIVGFFLSIGTKYLVPRRRVNISVGFILFEVADFYQFAVYIYWPVIITMGTLSLLKTIRLGKLGLSIYYGLGIFCYAALVLCELFELYFIEDLVTDHIVYLDRKHYLIDQEWLEKIRVEVREDMKKIRQEKMLELQEIDPRMFGDSVYQIYVKNQEINQKKKPLLDHTEEINDEEAGKITRGPAS